MIKQISIHKGEATGQETIWWKPMLTMQREICKTCQQMIPENIVPPAAWEAGNSMLAAMQEGIHNLFGQLFNNRQMLAPWWMGHPTEPYIDITESESGFTVKADVPGVEADDLDVSAVDGGLVVKGKKPKSQAKDHYLRHECCDESFSRTVALPEEADIEQAMANLDRNVLTINVPRKAMVGKVRKLNIAA
jgi:HSP20 family protein